MGKLLAALVAVVGCSQHGVFPDASPSDSQSEQAVCGSFSESLSCPDAATDTGTCSSPQGIFTSDAGFSIGCVVIENDRSEWIDGGCVTPVYACVAAPSPHWELTSAP